MSLRGSYNAGDQLLEEIVSDVAGDITERTEYGYTGTQQTEKTVIAADNSVDTHTTMTYDLQGRLELFEALGNEVETRSWNGREFGDNYGINGTVPETPPPPGS